MGKSSLYSICKFVLLCSSCGLLMSFSVEDKIKELEKQLQGGTLKEKIDAARDIAQLYRDSLYNIEKERDYLLLAINLGGDDLSEEHMTNVELNLAFNYLNAAEYDNAHQAFTKLRAYYQVQKDTLKELEIGEYIANTLQQQNKLPEALSTYYDIILDYRKQGTFEGYYIACLNSINAAYIQILQNNDRQALDLLMPCYEIETTSDEEIKKLTELSVNYDLFTARAYEELGVLDTAAAYYQKTLETSQSLKYPYTEAYAYLGLGGYELEANNDYPKARSYLENAVQIFREFDNIEGLIPALNRLSVSFNLLGQNQIAEDYASEAIDLATKINQHEGLKDGYRNMADISATFGRHEEAMDFYKIHVAYKDSILNTERDRTIQENNVKYQADIKDLEIENLTIKDQARQRQLIFGSIAAGAALLGLLALGKFLNTRQRLRQSKEAAQYEREISTALNRFVPMRFLKALGHDHILEVNLGDQIEQEVTVMFSDIRSFTSISEQMTPIENFRFVKEYAEAMGPIIVNNGGFINQYLGDGIMAIFQNKPDDALKACIEMQAAIRKYNHNRREQPDHYVINVGMGLHTGMLVMGIIGDEDRRDAALISDTVNTAARLESLTKEYGTKIILSQKTLEKLEDQSQFDFRYLGISKVKGKQHAISLYECINGDDNQVHMQKAGYKEEFEAAVKSLVAGEHHEAKEKFSLLSANNKNDLTLEKLLNRIKTSA